jgi:hypothetical protein
VYSSNTPNDSSYSRFSTQLESVGSTGRDSVRQDTPVPFAGLPRPGAAAHNGAGSCLDTHGQHVQQQSAPESGCSAESLPCPRPAEHVQPIRPPVLQYGPAAGGLAAPRPAAAVSLGHGTSPGASDSSVDTFTAAAAGRPPAAPRRQPLAGPAATLYRAGEGDEWQLKHSPRNTFAHNAFLTLAMLCFADASSVMKVMAALQAGRLLPPGPSAMGAPAASSAVGNRGASEPEGE